MAPHDEERIFQTFYEYKELLPFLKNKSLEEWTMNVIGNKPDRKALLLDLYKLSHLKGFFQSNLVKNAYIHKNKPADQTLLGSSCRVYEAELQGGEIIAAKVMNRNNISFTTLALEQAVHIKIAGMLEVGPKFHGFYITDDEKIVILMDKINGHGLNPEPGRNDFSGSKFINAKTLESFKAKIKRLQEAGYMFEGSEVQKLIGEDGTIYFIDIWLKKLRSTNLNEAQNNKWYRDNLKFMSVNI